jgi:hypothetical protein
MDDLRAVVAEAIQEMETDEVQRGNNDVGDNTREEVEEGRTSSVNGERRERRDHQQHQTPQQQQQNNTRPAPSTRTQRRDTVNRAAEQTPMQLM